MTSVLIVNHEPLTDRMTGPTIRHWELAHVLSSQSQVTLAVPGETTVRAGDFQIVTWDRELPSELISRHDVVCVFGYELDRQPGLAAARHLVVDLYDPFPLENLHMHEGAAISERHRIAAHDRAVQTALLRAGDVFLCASERQRDFWIGWLAAAGRVNPYLHEADPTLERYILIVPFGLPEQPPQKAARRFRGVVPGIGEQDLVVLWGGGIWNWFDPLSLIRAAAATADALPALRVVFPAAASPSPEVLPMRMAAEARKLSDELRLTGRRVFFGDKWVPYAERGSVLLEADVGISLHLQSVETEFSFRTRVLDYLWAGLPIVATDGDSMADLIRSEGLGAVVAPGDVEGLSKALIELGSSAERRLDCGRRSAAVARRFQWSAVARPLVEYCANPYVAPDRDAVRREPAGVSWDGRLGAPSEARRVIARAAQILTREGPGAVVDRGVRYLRGRRKT